MNTGPTKSQIKAEVCTLATEIPGIDSVYGFGSFFRSNIYADIDLVIVFTKDCHNTLAAFEAFLLGSNALGNRLHVKFDVTPLTRNEFARKPLRESDSLVPIYRQLSAEA